MTIRVQCTCGKSLSVQDALAGRTIKCPGCQKGVAVKPVAVAADLHDLFAEEGMHGHAGPVCPICSNPLKPNAVLCTHCGTHLQTGQKMLGVAAARMQGGSLGNATLDEAVVSMRSEAELQRRTTNTGMPWWFLLIMLVFLGFFTFSVVSIVNAAVAQSSATGFAATIKKVAANQGAVWGMIITGLVLQTFARVWLVVLGFKESLGDGITTLLLWHKFLGQLSDHPVVGLVYTLGFFTTLSGLGLAAANKWGA